jgi:hypothetical protein
MAGQSVGLVNKVPTPQEIVDEMLMGTEAEILRIKTTLCD